jgi:hypothetical protein
MLRERPFLDTTEPGPEFTIVSHRVTWTRTASSPAVTHRITVTRSWPGFVCHRRSHVAKLTGIILRIMHRCGMFFYTHAGLAE